MREHFGCSLCSLRLIFSSQNTLCGQIDKGAFPIGLCLHIGVILCLIGHGPAWAFLSGTRDCSNEDEAEIGCVWVYFDELFSELLFHKDACVRLSLV